MILQDVRLSVYPPHELCSVPLYRERVCRPCYVQGVNAAASCTGASAKRDGLLDGHRVCSMSPSTAISVELPFLACDCFVDISQTGKRRSRNDLLGRTTTSPISHSRDWRAVRFQPATNDRALPAGPISAVPVVLPSIRASRLQTNTGAARCAREGSEGKETK